MPDINGALKSRKLRIEMDIDLSYLALSYALKLRSENTARSRYLNIARRALSDASSCTNRWFPQDHYLQGSVSKLDNEINKFSFDQKYEKEIRRYF